MFTQDNSVPITDALSAEEFYLNPSIFTFNIGKWRQGPQLIYLYSVINDEQNPEHWK